MKKWERWLKKGIHLKELRITDSLLYQDLIEANENPHPEEYDSGNEVDIEPEEEECLWEINLL